MNILLIGPDPNNSTDGVIVKGMHNLFEHSFGSYTYKYVFINDHGYMIPDEFFYWEKFDIVAVCGTPWLWDSFQNSPKYKNLEMCFSVHSESKKLFMGVGSCLSLDNIDSNILERPEEVQAFKNTYSNATVIVRDHLAFDKLTKIRIDSHHLPCPAYFCYGVEFKPNDIKKDNVLIFMDPAKSISSSVWQDSSKVLKYRNLIKAFYSKYNPVVYCAKLEDRKNCLEIGLPEPILLDHYSETMKIMETANIVLSTRVHCGVPAFVQNKSIGLVPLDTRSFVLSDFGCPIITRVEDFSLLESKERNFSSYLNTYNEILRSLK